MSMSSSHDTRVNDMAAIRHNATALNIDVLLFLLFSMFIVLRFLDGCFSVFSLSVAGTRSSPCNLCIDANGQ